MSEPRQLLPAETPTLPIRGSHLAERLVDGELVLYDPRRQCVHALNPTAAFVWYSCDGEHDEADIVGALAERYPESRQAIEQNVPEILGSFHDEGLLEM